MKKVIILCGSVFTIIMIFNMLLNYFMLSVIMELLKKNNELMQSVEETRIVYYDYPNQYPNNPPETALPDEEIALEIGKALLEEYYGITDGKYRIVNGDYYWSVSIYTIIDSFTESQGNLEREMVTASMYYVDINKKDGRVLYTGYDDNLTLRADSLK